MLFFMDNLKELAEEEIIIGVDFHDPKLGRLFSYMSSGIFPKCFIV